jgi:cytochrome c1
MTADEIRAWITDPKAQAAKAKKPATMPAYSKLTKDDVDNLVAYLSSLKKK